MADDHRLIAVSLTQRELATLRAASRLWLETPPELIPERCYVEADDVLIEADDEIEQRLMVKLARAAAAAVEAPVDPRRV